jgi:hypothetical protein
MIIFGTRLFGRCEDVPGLFYVGTKFFHVNFVPLLPVKTTLVLEGSEQSTGLRGSSYRGFDLPMSLKSIAIAWARFGLCALALYWVVAGFIDRHGNRPMLLAQAAGAFALYVASRFVFRASFESAKALVEKIGSPPELVAAIEARYGKSIATGFEP